MQRSDLVKSQWILKFVVPFISLSSHPCSLQNLRFDMTMYSSVVNC